MKIKHGILATVLTLASYSAVADWNAQNGQCMTVTDNGSLMMVAKSESIVVLGQSQCRGKYDLRDEVVAINGKPYPALGFCDARTGYKPVAVIAKHIDISPIYAAIATQQSITLAALGTAGEVGTDDFQQTCSAVLPDIQRVAATESTKPDMGVVLQTAKHVFAADVGEEDDPESADWNTVRYLPDTQMDGQTVKVIQFEVYHVPYRTYYHVTAFVNLEGSVVKTTVAYAGR